MNFEEFEALVAEALDPLPFSITYDPTDQLIEFDLALFDSYMRDLDLSFTKDIDLGGLATLSLFGSGSADLSAAVRLGLAAAFDLTPLALDTKLADLNGGLVYAPMTTLAPTSM